MLMRKKDTINVDEFWETREKEIGAVIKRRVLGRVIQKEGLFPLWGLFYTTQDAVYFQTFASDNWMSLIFSKAKGYTQDATIKIPASSIIRFQTVPQKHGFLRIFRQPPLVDLCWMNPNTGTEESFLFEMEGDAQDFVYSVCLRRSSAPTSHQSS